MDKAATGESDMDRFKKFLIAADSSLCKNNIDEARKNYTSCVEIGSELPTMDEKSLKDALDGINKANSKEHGNLEFQTGNYQKAVEHYTTALALPFRSETKDFTSLLYYNRATAYEKMCKKMESISDYNKVIALKTGYAEPLIRRSVLFASLRDFEDAANDNTQLVSLAKANSPLMSKITTSVTTLEERLQKLQQLTQKQIPLDFYQILAIEKNATHSEVRKAYLSAARKYHPDKIEHFLANNINMKEDANLLFNLVAKAYRCLSDPKERAQYDEQVQRYEDTVKKNKRDRESEADKLKNIKKSRY